MYTQPDGEEAEGAWSLSAFIFKVLDTKGGVGRRILHRMIWENLTG